MARRKVNPVDLGIPLDNNAQPIDLKALGRAFVESQRNAEPSTLEKAQQLSYELGTVTDTLNESLKRAQTALGKLRLGVSASVLLSDDDEPTQLLSLRKMGAKWLLVIDTALNPAEDEWSETELLSASRELRLVAAGKMDALLEDLVESAEDELRNTRTSIESVEEFSERVEACRVRRK